MKYEEFARSVDTITNIRQFTESDVGGNTVGSFHKRLGRGDYELHIHNGTISGKQVNRWERETDIELINNFNEFYELMKDYREFWGY